MDDAPVRDTLDDAQERASIAKRDDSRDANRSAAAAAMKGAREKMRMR
ncbi:MAG TPA: hypothetical protein VGJ20_40175 [Xanthobacteraceae bacterium]|jgi:hypothetical protein